MVRAEISSFTRHVIVWKFRAKYFSFWTEVLSFWENICSILNELIYDHFEKNSVHLEKYYALIFEYHKIELIVLKLENLRKILLKMSFDAHYFW